MIKWTTSVIVVCLLAITVICRQPAEASSSAAKETRFAEKVKEGILKLGVGRTARANITLRDKTKLTGYISETTESSFAVTDLKTAVTKTVAYRDVSQVKGNNLSSGAKIAIAAGIIAGVIIVLYIVRGAFCDGC